MRLKIALPAASLVLLSGTLYGSLGFFGTQLQKENLSITSMLFWRFFVAMLWMLGSEFIFKKDFRSQFIHRNFSWSLLLSGIFYAGSSVFYFFASKDTGTGLAMVIFFAYPVFVAISTWAKNNWHVNPAALLSLLVVLFGLYLLQVNNLSPIKATSLLLALLASLSYALYISKSKQLLERFQPSYFTIVICFMCALIFFICSNFAHDFAMPHSLKGWSYVLALGVIATALPIQLMLDGMKSISALKASILSSLEPVVTLLVGIMALDETISSVQLIGVMIIIVGTLLIQFSRD